jgi:hypothetical protein
MTPEDLRDADLPCTAKGKGGALRDLDKSMNAPAQERMDLELDLSNAVARGEFVLHYRRSSSPHRAHREMEALVRWKHPQRGLLFPATSWASEETGSSCPRALGAPRSLPPDAPVAACHAGDGPGDQREPLRAAAAAARPVEEIAAVLWGVRAGRAAPRSRRRWSRRRADHPGCCALKALGVQLAIDDF